MAAEVSSEEVRALSLCSETGRRRGLLSSSGMAMSAYRSSLKAGVAVRRDREDALWSENPNT